MKYNIKGINDDKDICEHCGKTHLKKVVWLAELDQEGNETGEIIAVGTTCASKLMTGKKSRKEGDNIWSVARAVHYANKWLAKGYTPYQVTGFISSHFGYINGKRGNQIIIGSYKNPLAIIQL